MKRVAVQPRIDWQAKVEEVGVTYHHTYIPKGTPQNGEEQEFEETLYWDESAAYEFTLKEIEEVERAVNDLDAMCLQAAEKIITDNRFEELAIPPNAIQPIRDSWDAEPPSIYGRFDFSYDGKGPPKMLEYNADTPTGLVEASVAQWYWLKDVMKGRDQFNSIDEKLVAKWKDVFSYLKMGPVFFAHANNRDTEDLMTTQYMRDVATRGGLNTASILMDQIGWDSRKDAFVDQDGLELLNIFKLYPWEWMLGDEYGAHVFNANTMWIEPEWKMLLSNKGILPVLWEMFPNHPNLLPAYFDGPHDMAAFARKPLLGREGGSVSLFQHGEQPIHRDSEYGEEGYVWQGLCPLPDFDGFRPCIGGWHVRDQGAAGIGIREDTSAITSNYSRFVPHYF